jgi:hypothetical protein
VPLDDHLLLSSEDERFELSRFIRSHSSYAKNSDEHIPLGRLESHGHLSLAREEFCRYYIAHIDELLFLIRTEV